MKKNSKTKRKKSHEKIKEKTRRMNLALDYLSKYIVLNYN